MEVASNETCYAFPEGSCMLEALEINFALWGMLICAAVKLTQWIEYAF